MIIEQALIQATSEYIRKGRVPGPNDNGEYVTVKPGKRKGRNVKGYKRRKPGKGKKRVPTKKRPPGSSNSRAGTALNVLHTLGHGGETLAEALKDFQTKSGLDSTGALDPKTMDALRKKIAAARRKRRRRRKVRSSSASVAQKNSV